MCAVIGIGLFVILPIAALVFDAWNIASQREHEYRMARLEAEQRALDLGREK